MKLFNFKNTSIDFNLGKCTSATISAAELTFLNRNILGVAFQDWKIIN